MNTPATPATGAELHVESYYTTLWLKALMLAGNAGLAPFTDELDELATEFFWRFRPFAEA